MSGVSGVLVGSSVVRSAGRSSSTGSWLVFDCDGCIRQPHAGQPPVAPPAMVGETLRRLHRAEYKLAVATGAGPNGVRVTEQQLGFEFDILAASYCGVYVERNGHAAQSFLVPHEERAALAEVTPTLERIAASYDGDVTDREGVCFSFHLTRHPQSFPAAHDEMSKMVAGNTRLRFLPTSHDLGLVVAAASAGKRLLLDQLQRPGNTILVGAGDTKADTVLLEAADFPIVTLTDEETRPEPALVAIVEHKGCGYIASEPHGFGLAAGLLAARAAGVVNF